MRRSYQLLVLIVTLAMAACAQPGGRAPRAGTPPEINPSWSSCDAALPDGSQFGGTADAIDLPLLDDSFTPTSAVLCQTRSDKRADGGEDIVAVEDKATDITALVHALRLPSQPLTDGACLADLPLVAWFALLDAEGRWVRPGVPSDACGKIRIEVRDAVAGLRLTPVSKRAIREVVSAEANAAGCTQQWADMVWVETRSGGPWEDFTSDWLGNGGQTRLCRYRVPESEQRSGKPTGDFERGGLLTDTRWAKIRESIRKAVPVRDCTTPAGRFAVLRRADDSGGIVYVELDGCRRVMVAPNSGRPSLTQADAALVALVDSAV